MSEQEKPQENEKPPEQEKSTEQEKQTEEEKKKEEEKKTEEEKEKEEEKKIEEEKPKEKEETKKKEKIPISPNLYQEIITLKEKNIYIPSESFAEKIPEIFSYLLEKGNEYPIPNKIQLLKYMQDLIKKIEYYPGILSGKKSLNEDLNIFEVIINQYITNKEKDYITELKNIFILLLNKI